MKYSSMNLFSIILIIFVVFILFLCSPVYKIISGEGSKKFHLIEGMTTGENKLEGSGTSGSPFIVPATLIVRPADSNWKKKIETNDKNESGISGWSIDDQFMSTGAPNYIGDQYRHFAELWLAKLNAKPGQLYTANVRGNNYSKDKTLSDYGKYKFSITTLNSNGSINYSGIFNGKGWGWVSVPLSPAPEPYFTPNAFTTAAASNINVGGIVVDSSYPVNTEKPKISGEKSVGSTLECSKGKWQNERNLKYSYQWYRGTDKILGETKSTYKIVSADTGKGITCEVTATNQFGLGADRPVKSDPIFIPTNEKEEDNSGGIPSPLPGKKQDFGKKKCNDPNKSDGNCYPACIPVGEHGKVIGPPYEIYGGKDNSRGPDGQPFNQNTANYLYERPLGGSDYGGKYYPKTDVVAYGSATDCMPKPNSAPSPSPVGGGCDPSCTKVKDPRLAGGACKLDKSIGKIVCYACPKIDNGEIDCNNFREKCSGCGPNLRAYFDPNKPYPSPEPKEKPFTPTECQSNCKKPGVEIFQRYLDTFHDGSGNGSCQIIRRNMVKCRPVNKSGGADECLLCKDPGLQGYATFNRKWDDYTKQNNYVDVKLVDGPLSRDDGDDGRGGQGRGRGAGYGPSDGSGSGSRDSNWGNWDGGGDNAGWRRNRGSGGGSGSGGGGGIGSGWYQSLSDAKSKSFQVAASNAKSSQQQAYIESLKLELNKVNDEYTTQQVEVNKMKAGIDKMVTACQSAKSKLSDAMRSSVSDNMNKNAAITMKEKVDANANTSNIAFLKQSVKESCDNSSQLSASYNNAMKRLTAADAKRQALIEKLVVAMDGVTENKTTININVGGGGGMGDCGDRLGCGTGIRYNNIYTDGYFKPQHIDDMINNVNVPMPYQDLILF